MLRNRPRLTEVRSSSRIGKHSRTAVLPWRGSRACFPGESSFNHNQDSSMLLCAVLFLLLPQNDLLSLTGSVLDPAAKPAQAVHLRLEQPTEQKQWETITEEDGTFRFDRLSYGTYRLTMHKDGYFD